MFNTPENVTYTKDHEWVLENPDGTVRMGITDYAQSALGDIVYIQLPKIDATIKGGAVCGEVESTKSVSEIYAPVEGKVVRVNEKLETNPELINSDPYGDGWIAEISDVVRTEQLLSASEYSTLTA
ncbi:MAG: glycine cleavage system protein GcvH [Actinomycetes bacterium]